MKHLLILLVAFSLITSCNNNNKKNDPRGYDPREKDDYRSQDKTDEDNNDKKNTDFNDNESWSAADIRKFNNLCLQSVKNDEELADKFCPCVLEKMQKKYSSYEDLDTRGTEAEGKRIGEECRDELGLGNTGNNNSRSNTSGGGWSAAEVDAFVSNCTKEAVRGGMSRSQATNYCSCMQEKFEQMYPNAQDAGGISEDDMNTPAMKRLIQGCLDN